MKYILNENLEPDQINIDPECGVTYLGSNIYSMIVKPKRVVEEEPYNFYKIKQSSKIKERNNKRRLLEKLAK